MDNQTICAFVNSKDVRSYLAEINYQFTPAEAAWLVAKCEHLTMEERHTAWEDIIDTMPDCKEESVHWTTEESGLYDSLHGILRKVIAMDRRYLEEFRRKGDHAVYQYTIDYLDCERLEDYDDSPLFSQLDACLAAVKEDIAKYGSDDIWFISIRKNYIDDPDRNIELYFNSNCDVTSMARGVSRNDEEGNLEYVFDDMWFCIPAPFKKGDIVWQRNRIVEAGPLVVEGITPDRYAETGHRGADSSDMNVWGYFQGYDGGIFYEVTFNYMDFEYYPEEMLVGKKRILKALSNYLKGKIDIELFSTAYQRILLEEQLKDTMPNCFTDEGLRLAGIIE